MDKKQQNSSLLRLAREALRRRPTYILVALGVCLAYVIAQSVEGIRDGNASALVLVGANIIVFVIALIYLADDLQSR